jgi:hypothetical protein
MVKPNLPLSDDELGIVCFRLSLLCELGEVLTLQQSLQTPFGLGFLLCHYKTPGRLSAYQAFLQDDPSTCGII